MMPATYPKDTLLARWREAAPRGLVSPLSAVVPGADHVLLQGEARRWVAGRVVRFLRGVEGEGKGEGEVEVDG